MPRPIRLEIHVDAMRHNLAVVRSRLQGGARVWAVAKAHAYGHGIAQAVAGFANADGLAVLDLHEAVVARDLGWSKPILLIEGAFHEGDLSEMARLDLSTVVSTPEQARMALESARVPSQVWVKLNTGMNRLGLRPDRDAPTFIRLLQGIESRMDQPLNWMMHFANADASLRAEAPEPRVSWTSQKTLFDQCLAQWGRSLRSGGFRSLANSAATLALPETHADWVRPGTALYGGTPFSHDEPNRSSAALGLRPVQHFLSEVIAIQELDTGDAVGYGSRFQAQRPTRIAVVACGYADGYPRSAPDGTPVWIEGRALPMAGRVSMDMLTVDVTDHPLVHVGSAVELWGDHLPIDQVANLSGTIGYELMTRITPRVPRRVIDLSTN